MRTTPPHENALLAAVSGAKVLPTGGGSSEQAAPGEFSLWHNLNHAHLLPGSKTLLTFLGDPQAEPPS